MTSSPLSSHTLAHALKFRACIFISTGPSLRAGPALVTCSWSMGGLAHGKRTELNAPLVDDALLASGHWQLQCLSLSQNTRVIFKRLNSGICSFIGGSNKETGVGIQSRRIFELRRQSPQLRHYTSFNVAFLTSPLHLPPAEELVCYIHHPAHPACISLSALHYLQSHKTVFSLVRQIDVG